MGKWEKSRKEENSDTHTHSAPGSGWLDLPSPSALLGEQAHSGSKLCGEEAEDSPHPTSPLSLINAFQIISHIKHGGRRCDLGGKKTGVGDEGRKEYRISWQGGLEVCVVFNKLEGR